MNTITRHIIAITLTLTLCFLTLMYFDLWTAQKKNDIKPVVINIERADYVSMITGPQVEWDVKEGK